MMPEVQNIIQYFNIPKEQILIIASKIITGHCTNHQAQEALESINISLVKKIDDSQSIFINETLNNFHLTIKATTIDLWEINLHSQQLAEANQKFKIKMEQSKLKSATKATAKALHKATESINQQNTADAITQLRLTNLEKLLQHQHQTSKEILYHINKKPTGDHLNEQKNLRGSQTGLMATPIQTMNLHQKDIVDLSLSPPHTSNNPSHRNKRQRVQ
jgi:hypothetical protein